MEDKELQINEIREYLLSRENTPYISFNNIFDVSEIATALNGSFANDSISAFINPPIDKKTGVSIPEIATDFVVLKNGDVYCRTTIYNEYNLRDLLGESLSTIIKAINKIKQKNERP